MFKFHPITCFLLCLFVKDLAVERCHWNELHNYFVHWIAPRQPSNTLPNSDEMNKRPFFTFYKTLQELQPPMTETLPMYETVTESLIWPFTVNWWHRDSCLFSDSKTGGLRWLLEPLGLSQFSRLVCDWWKGVEHHLNVTTRHHNVKLNCCKSLLGVKWAASG